MACQVDKATYCSKFVCVCLRVCVLLSPYGCGCPWIHNLAPENSVCVVCPIERQIWCTRAEEGWFALQRGRTVTEGWVCVYSLNVCLWSPLLSAFVYFYVFLLDIQKPQNPQINIQYTLHTFSLIYINRKKKPMVKENKPTLYWAVSHLSSVILCSSAPVSLPPHSLEY